MATATVPTTPQSSLLSTARAIFVGLLWAAAMLLVFSFWMRSKYEPSGKIVTNVFLGAGVAAAALALWQAFTLWFSKETPEQKTATLAKQHRLFSYIFLAAGLGLIVLAFVLGVGKKPNGETSFILGNFAETIGTLLFGLIALGSGYFLQLPQDEKISPIQFLVGKVPLLKMSQVILAALALGTFCYLGFYKKIGFEWFPELSALIAMSMLCVGCFLWLNTGDLDEFGVRLFVLVFGGCTGLVLFFWSIGRAIFWRQDVFLSGMAAWQGEDAWRFWLCAYAFFASLVLMFVSFNLARADIRKSVVLRRVMYGYDALLQCLLLLGVLTVLNVVCYARFPFTYDWTKTRGAYSLSDSTKNLITGLKKEINIVVLLPQTTWVYKDIHNLMDNCTALNSRLKVQYVSPDVDQIKYEALADIFKQILPDPRGGGGRGILIVNGAIPIKDKADVEVPPYVFVAERKLFEVDRAGGQQAGGRNQNFFKGESEILKELKFLLQDRTKRKVYVLQGDEEPDVFDKTGGVERGLDFRTGFRAVGMGILADKLEKDNYDVFGLTFNPEFGEQKNPNLVHAKAEGANKKKEIPADCKTLIVAGVSRMLPSDTVEAIERYMERGGKMLVFLDVIANADFSKMKDTGLEPLLKRFGVEVTDQFALTVIDDPRIEDARTLWAETPLQSDNPLPKQFADKYFYLKRSARILKPAATPGRYKAESIMELYPAGKAVRPSVNFKEIKVLANPQQAMWDLRRADERILVQALNHVPAVVGVAVTDTNGDKPCLVVFGDTEFITNRELALSKSRDVNYTMTVSAMEWIAERDAIGAPPKVNASFSLKDGVNTTRMVLLPGWLMLLGITGMGVGIWVTRRR